MITKPLLACAVKDEHFELLKFPLIATPKLDGIRCLKIDGQVVSRKFKPIPNRFIRATLEKILPDGIDGEIMLKDPKATFQDISSAVMSFEGTPDFVYCPFDYVKNGLEEYYHKRLESLMGWIELISTTNARQFIKLVPHYDVNESNFAWLERKFLRSGYEGIMLRHPMSPYKCGRSTFKEHILLKVKRFEQSEATIIGIIEKLTNENEQERDELGYSKRSSAKAGKVAAGTLGAFIVRDLATGIEFRIGSGFDDSLREKVWSKHKDYMGKIVTYTYQPIGVLEAPRFPVFKGFRDEIDL